MPQAIFALHYKLVTPYNQAIRCLFCTYIERCLWLFGEFRWGLKVPRSVCGIERGCTCLPWFHHTSEARLFMPIGSRLVMGSP
ncbi:hypothetical protein Psta_4721 [Pirellula staleyi DSM 6068]|uniref:Uncharacterized protein n=1 Tax=Pirellula staleyi (strain ATCC 27377 / DSM 6068 / ICPB 4128) TaxID=530564 RepID=D2R831_PIRSD|nr:hypothetical protein Psta_4721 [Pirellula staleyi DSM 6068]